MEKEQNSKFEFSFARLINIKLEGYSPEQVEMMLNKILMNRLLIFLTLIVVILVVVACMKFPSFINHIKLFFL